MKKYKVLADLNDDGLILKKGNVYLGIKKDDGSLLLWVNGKSISEPFMATEGSPGFKETNEATTEVKTKTALAASVSLIFATTLIAISLRHKIGNHAVAGLIAGSILSGIVIYTIGKK